MFSLKPVCSPTLAYRLAVLSRVVAAVAGGYLLTALCTVVAARYLPMSRADAVMTAPAHRRGKSHGNLIGGRRIGD